MTGTLLQSIQRICHFSSGELEALEKAVERKKLAKGDFILKRGDICQALHFVVSGALLQYKLDEDMEESVLDLYTEEDWAFCHKSFTAQKPSDSYIRANEDSLVLELTIHALHQLIAESPAFFQMGKILERSTARMALFDDNKTPDDRYLQLLKDAGPHSEISSKNDRFLSADLAGDFEQGSEQNKERLIS